MNVLEVDSLVVRMNNARGAAKAAAPASGAAAPAPAAGAK